MLGITFFFIGFFRSRKANYYERATGVIVRGKKNSLLEYTNFSELVDKLYEGRTIPDRYPTVAYEVEGKIYTYKSAMSQSPGLRIGTKVDVLYDPYQPEKALIDTFVQRGSLFTLLGSIFLIVALIGFGLTFYFEALFDIS